MTVPPGPRRPLRFADLAAALLARAEHLLPLWLPGGRRDGHEWVCGDLSGSAGQSCKVNLHTGRWADFAGGEETGGDLISLYAAIHGLDNGKAAVQVARELGLEAVLGLEVRQAAGPVQAPAPAPQPAPKPMPPRIDESWRTVRPVPPTAPAVNFRHHERQAEAIEHVAEYRHGDTLHGYVVRFRTSDGGKDTLPRTWCVSARDGAAQWKWRQFDAPRPLYLPAHELPALGGRSTVVLVEGERKAQVLQAVLDGYAPGVYCVATWPGGCKTWQKADWAPLAQCSVLAWPDCDAKREQLSRAERAQVKGNPAAEEVLKQAKPLLPASKQPGLQAMLGIGHLLQAQHGCTVQLLPIPAPGAVPDGWDCADAIERDGWTADQVLNLFAQAQPLPAPAPAPPAARDGAGTGDRAAGGGGHDEPPEKKSVGPGEPPPDEDAFAEHLAFLCESMKCKVWELAVNRRLVIAALRKAPALAGCLGHNELTNAPSTVRPWPWRECAGPLAETDDLRLGDWLSKTYKLKAASRAALAEAIDTVADERRFHPFRDWLQGLEWDGTERLEKWLMHVLGKDPETLAVREEKYLRLMSRMVLIGHVARVMQPGCKFDYSPVLEGLPGIGKSTMIKVLVGEAYFSDTHFDIGSGKEGMEQLEGLLAYELSEMTAFRRADSEQVKQFFSSQVDRYRGAYGKFVQPHPRQCVIWCTTNKRVYLYDLTGNRRFLPVWCDQPLKVEWLAKWRGQLFAEAFRAWQAGDRCYPTREEEKAYFWPQQEARLVETTVQAKLYDLLTREGAPALEARKSSDISRFTEFVTLPLLTEALGADSAKSTSVLEGQIRGWLEAHGWAASRESTGSRRRGYKRPKEWPPEVADDELRPAATVVAGSVSETLGGAAQPEPSDGRADDEPF